MSVFRSENGNIYLDSQYCEFYIPMYYFDGAHGKFAVDNGNTINVLGIFNVGIFEKDQLKEMRVLNLPTFITINVYESDIREVTLSTGDQLPCKVVKYLKNSNIMSSTIISDDENVKKFLNFLTSGSLPKIVPYSDLLRVWLKNQTINAIDFDVSSCYLELVLSTMCRDKDNLSRKFSKIASNPGIDDYDYKFVSMRQICQYNSTFTAITFEDMDSMITTSINKSRDKVKENESPVEKIIKF